MAGQFSYWVPLKALIHGILAIALSFAAYSKRITSEEVTDFNGVCEYPSSSAWYLALIAAIALLAEQITLSVGMGCFCCRGARCSSNCTAIISIFFFIFSWLAFSIVFIGLMYTAAVNNHKFLVKHHSLRANGGSCFIGMKQMNLGAASWCLIKTVFGLISYAFWACGKDRDNNKNC
ncbi:uncharacterized protein LOC110696212 [Chenopodium quinoa]|uniref:uncharacterized protein LOC110696212 n=1 Tax=Chenopodium quinoa TaxID=63459 RepID=UPI000B78CE50|nr:uncharacterized protein LOC110696212 [Chenopodium quinoa]